MPGRKHGLPPLTKSALGPTRPATVSSHKMSWADNDASRRPAYLPPHMRGGVNPAPPPPGNGFQGYNQGFGPRPGGFGGGRGGGFGGGGRGGYGGGGRGGGYGRGFGQAGSGIHPDEDPFKKNEKENQVRFFHLTDLRRLRGGLRATCRRNGGPEIWAGKVTAV